MSEPVIIYLSDDQVEFVEVAKDDWWHVRLPGSDDMTLTTLRVLEISPRSVLFSDALLGRARYITKEVKWVEKVGGA